MSRSTRTRLILGLGASAFLLAAGLVPAPAHAEAVTDYSITVDPTTKGAKIDKTMYGVFFEDINRAADGGLYAELVQNRSFEYSTADNTSYTYFGWRQDVAPFTDVKVRRALNHAVDVPSMIKEVLQGYASQATGQFSPSS